MITRYGDLYEGTKVWGNTSISTSASLIAVRQRSVSSLQYYLVLRPSHLTYLVLLPSPLPHPSIGPDSCSYSICPGVKEILLLITRSLYEPTKNTPLGLYPNS